MPNSLVADTTASRGSSNKLVRLTLPGTILKYFLELSDRLQLERTDLMELLIIRGWPSELESPEVAAEHERRTAIATKLIDGFANGQALSRFDVEARIEAPVNVTALRMAARREVDPGEVDAGQGYFRTHMGMDLLDGPEEVWAQARGYWTAQPDAEYLVPVRLGYAPYVFRTNRWKRTEGSVRRIWATSGHLIDFEQKLAVPLVDTPDFDAPAKLDYSAAQPANELDLQVAEAVAGQIISFTVGSSNPVMRLRQRGHRLS